MWQTRCSTFYLLIFTLMFVYTLTLTANYLRSLQPNTEERRIKIQKCASLLMASPEEVSPSSLWQKPEHVPCLWEAWGEAGRRLQTPASRAGRRVCGTNFWPLWGGRSVYFLGGFLKGRELTLLPFSLAADHLAATPAAILGHGVTLRSLRKPH